MEFASLVELIAKSPFFAGASKEAIETLVQEADLVHIPAGEVIIEEGEYEQICYIVLKGAFEVLVTDKETGKKRQVRSLGPGELLGEMSILSGNPRLAEVRCVREARLLRIGREGFLKLIDSTPAVKERLDERYRERALLGSLKSVDVLSGIEGPTMKAIAKQVKLEVRAKGDVIFSEGDDADAFYLIRDGFVQISRAADKDESRFFDSRFDKAYISPSKAKKKEEFILAYLGRGFYFGERSLFGNRRRSATARALTRVELVKIGKREFNKILLAYPEVASGLKAIAAERYTDSTKIQSETEQDMLKWVASHDILTADAVLILDLNQCVRCLNCIVTCAKLHQGVTRITHNGVRYRNILIPTSCRHCREPTCMIGCPTGAIKRNTHGEVYHTDECIGCGNCARRCPFGNISIVDRQTDGAGLRMTDRVRSWIGGGRVTAGDHVAADDRVAAGGKKAVRQRAVKCDLCMDFDHLGCQHNCPTGAIKSVKPSEYFTTYGRVAK